MGLQQKGPTSVAFELPDGEEKSKAPSHLPASMQETVREELARLISSPRFSSSHRCQTLLQHVVTNALLGKIDLLKERSIGNAVFGRDLDYDTNSDAVVRIAAGEVRKKLAQYYYEPANQYKVRIELPAGSYVPVLSWPENEDDNTAKKSNRPSYGQDSLAASSKRLFRMPSRTRRLLWFLLAACLLLTLAATLFYRFRPMRQDAFTRFWEPFLQAPTPVLLCVGHRMLAWSEYDAQRIAAATPAAPLPSASNIRKNRPVILLSDSISLSNLTGVLREQKQPYSIRGQAFSTFGDLQKGPVILLGAFNNVWAMRLMEPMRYHFAFEANNVREWIVDTKNPGHQIGLVQTSALDYTTEDYALVVRTFDPQTKQPTLIVAGVTSTATRAASDFVTTPAFLNDYFAKAPAGWQNKNMELLLVAQNIKGEPGPARVVDSYFW